MAWCPKCNKEYSGEITHCPDCNVELQDMVSLRNELLDSLKPYAFKEDFTMQDLVDELDGSDKKPQSAKLYKSARDRYADARSTAFSFLFIGGIGLAVSVLNLVGIFTLPLHGFAVYTMTAVFSIFVLIGLFSMKESQKHLAAIGKEQDQIQAVKKWYREDGIHADVLCSLETSNEPEEERYLKKYKMIGELLRSQFPDVEEALLDQRASDFCEATVS